VEPTEILRQLVELAEQAGITVRLLGASPTDPLAGSGLCRLRGRLVLILAAAEPIDARIEAVADALRRHAGALLEERFLPPALRERIEARGDGSR
jgi:hypothetical protein